jgi:hypothetical protein
MEITWFEWDDNNIEHIVRHDVTPDEVEGVAFGISLITPPLNTPILFPKLSVNNASAGQ